MADIHAVAAPSSQTVAINGSAAQFDGSGSYSDDPPPVNYWAWDFDGDGTDDYSEDEYVQWGDGKTTYVYPKAGIFTVRLTAKNNAQQSDTDTQEVKVRLQVSSGEVTGTSVELLWQNANNSTQFTRYEVHKSTSQGFTPSQNTLVANVTQMATTSYTVTGLSVKTTYYFQVVLVVSGGSLESNELQRSTGGKVGLKYLYDKVGRRTKVLYTDDGAANWQTTEYRYDTRSELTKVTFPDSKTVSYFYDKAGERTRMVDPASDVLSYLYDARGALTRVQVGDTAHGSYFYDDAGRRTKLLYGNSASASYLYDDANRLTLLSNKKSDATVVSSFAYSVDKTGNRTKLALSNGDYAEYLYDQTYQLTREHRKDSQNATLYYNNFFYDPAGNRTRLEYNDGTSTTTTSYLYNTADQLTRESVGGTNTTYLYDPNGNLTKKDDGTNVYAYGYDFRNLMTDYDGPGANNDAAYKYGASGLRVQKTVAGSTTTKYYQDGLNTVAEYNGSNQLQRTYVTPGLDQNLSLTASGNTYYYLSDALGSIRQVLDGDQATQDSYDYQAFGSVYGSPTENVSQPYRFTGREWDGESGLCYYRGRVYHAGLGRFLSRDPLEPRSRSHPYVYARNNPAVHTDALGSTDEQGPGPGKDGLWRGERAIQFTIVQDVPWPEYIDPEYPWTIHWGERYIPVATWKGAFHWSCHDKGANVIKTDGWTGFYGIGWHSFGAGFSVETFNGTEWVPEGPDYECLEIHMEATVVWSAALIANIRMRMQSDVFHLKCPKVKRRLPDSPQASPEDEPAAIARKMAYAAEEERRAELLQQIVNQSRIEDLEYMERKNREAQMGYDESRSQ
jgi:RHS repeat-associated protein